MIILADDLSGAAEVAGIAHRFGLAPGLWIGAPGTGALGTNVADTGTRELPGAEAAAVLAGIGESLVRDGAGVAFKKVDSVLRGPVRAELEALMAASGTERCILAPCNPSRGRTIDGGIYRIDGVTLDRTAFALDPTHPAGTARVAGLLGPGALPVTCAAPGDPLPSRGIVIGDARREDDMDAWAHRLAPGTLAAGAADFLTAILRAAGLRCDHRAPVINPEARVVLVSGTASAAGRATLSAMRAAGAAVALVPPLPSDEMVEALALAPRAALAIDPTVSDAAPSALLEALSRAAGALLARGEPGRVLLEGGATASAVAAAMGWRRFRVEGEIAPGIVAVRPEGRSGPQIVLKPGSYRWPEGLG